MFIWDFTALFAVWGFLFLTIVLLMWVFYTLRRAKPLAVFKDVENFRHCVYCGYVYLDYFKADVCRCPRCFSYHD